MKLYLLFSYLTLFHLLNFFMFIQCFFARCFVFLDFIIMYFLFPIKRRHITSSTNSIFRILIVLSVQWNSYYFSSKIFFLRSLYLSPNLDWLLPLAPIFCFFFLINLIIHSCLLDSLNSFLDYLFILMEYTSSEIYK